MTDKKLIEESEEFKNLVKPLMEWLNKNHHPHTKIIIETTHAELLEGKIGFTDYELIQD